MRHILFILGFSMLFLLPNALHAQQVKRHFLDPANRDTSARPGDDFYRYANGGWLQNNPIPPSETRWGSNNVLGEQTRHRIKDILEKAAANTKPGPIEKRVGDFYAAAMDTQRINALKALPLMQDLKRIGTITDISGILKEVAYQRTNGMGSPLFNFGISPDRKNVLRHVPQFAQGGTGLPDRDNYLKSDVRSTAIQAAYKTYISELFRLTQVHLSREVLQAADSIYDLEKELAAAQLTRLELRDPYKTYNKFSVAALTQLSRSINWRELLSFYGITGQDSVWINAPQYFHKVNDLLAKKSLNTWKAYLAWNVLRSAAPYLDDRFVAANFAYNQAVSGQKTQQPREQRMASLTDASIGQLLGQLYVKEYFTPEAKARVSVMVQNLFKAYENRIRNLDWMSDSTKTKALQKLSAVTAKIGYPDKWENYEGLVISRTNFLQNLRNVGAWNYKKSFKRLGKPIDKTEWRMTPATVNASYSALTNEVLFPAGYLQFPWFDVEADDAVNYGGIGAVIGHELSHGFDDQGSQYDAKGNLSNWWSAEDLARFRAKTKALAAQYDAYTVLDTLHVNGAFTLGENIGDLGGLNVAYDAFKMTKQGQSNERIDGLTPDQRFFLSWAQIRKSSFRPEAAAQALLTDPHAPSEYRAIGPPVNMDAWYKAFNVQPGDKLYKQPGDRIRIW